MAGTSCSCKLIRYHDAKRSKILPSYSGERQPRSRVRGNPKARAKCSNLLRIPTADFPTSAATKATPPCLSRL